MLQANPRMKTFASSLFPFVLVLGVVAAVYGFWWRTAAPPPVLAPLGAPPPTSPAIEERWGVRVKQVGVTADGGLLDFRYLVLDTDKSMAMHQDPTTQPYIIDEASGVVINSSPTMSHKHILNPGLTYFELYRNPKGVVKPGSMLTVVIGDLRLEHLVAQ